MFHLLFILITGVLCAEIKICVKNEGIYGFAYISALPSQSVDESLLSHEQVPDFLKLYVESGTLAYNFIDNRCSIFKIPGIGRYSVKIWPFISTSKVSSLQELTLPAKFDRAEYQIDIQDSNFKKTLILDVTLGAKSISGSIIVSAGQIDPKTILVVAMNEDNHSFIGNVSSDFSYEVTNLPVGNYRVFPIKLNSIIHLPKDANIFCSNYYLNRPHHSCIYTHVYNSGVDRLVGKPRLIRSGDDFLNPSIHLNHSTNNVDLDILGNSRDSTISLLIKSKRKTLFTVELHEYIPGKNATKKLSQSSSRMENIDFHGLDRGKYLVQVWLAPFGVDSVDSTVTKGGFMAETVVNIEPYIGTVYVGIDFDLLFKGKTYLDDNDPIFNSFVEYLMKIFGKLPVHIISWILLIYGITCYFGYSDNIFHKNIKNLLLKTQIKYKSNFKIN